MGKDGITYHGVNRAIFCHSEGELISFLVISKGGNEVVEQVYPLLHTRPALLEGGHCSDFLSHCG
jgi:hypothetical protein